MEVKIGVTDSPRELVVNSVLTPDEVEALVTKSLAEAGGVLSLVDEKGRKFLVQAARITYVEIGPSDSRKVGFAPTS
ncbi:DUF3107 domain-containing protein [Rhodococcus hoagii]|nr:DUF3107 domain-containing protein [Prescottella equi]